MSTIEFPRPHSQEETAPAARVAVDTPFAVTFEQIAYVLIAIAAIITRFWGLGDRALHHDETLHAAYSWFIHVGRGYIHDPLLHGPFLYYFGSLNYFLFGDNDFTARLGAAVFSILLTLSPWLVRRELGRGTALLASVAMLISPIFLYVGRFIRHDIYSVLFEMLVFVGIIRYISTQQARWLYLIAAAFGLMMVNQETSYLFLVIMAAPLSLMILWRLFRPGIAVVGVLGFLVAALVFVLPGTAIVDGAHNAQRNPDGTIKVEKPGPIFGWGPLETEDNMYALRIRNRDDNDGGRSLLQNIGAYFADLGKFFAHPAIISAIGLILAAVAGLIYMIWFRPGPDGQTRWQLLQAANDPPAQVIASLGRDQRLWIALAIMFAIYALFFTAFLTNLLGVITGTTGSILYWLAQHNVERGGQPAHYYTVQLIVYEPLVVLWGLAAYIYIALDAWRERRIPSPLILLLAWWSLAALGIYTWAGEKMPWLTIHIVLPLTLLSVTALSRALRGRGSLPALSVDPEVPAERLALPIYAGGFTLFAGFWFIAVTAYVGFKQPFFVPLWALHLFLLVLLGMLTGAASALWGWRRSLSMLALCVTVALNLYTARSAFRLNYISGDTPREMMIYTQTSPDVVRVVRRLEEASLMRGQGLDMPVIYDNETVWLWYMRDFTRATPTGPQLTAVPSPEVQAVVMLQENLDMHPQNLEVLKDFVIHRYPLRWWLPEDEVYRLRSDWRETPDPSQLSILGYWLRDPLSFESQSAVWRYLLNRDTGAPLGSSDFIIAVRPNLADEIGLGLGGSLQPTNP